MSTSFIPAADDAFDHFATTLKTQMNLYFAAYGVSDDQNTALQAAYSTWETAWSAWQTLQETYAAKLYDKDTARNALEPIIREINNTVQADPDVTDAQKATAGLPVHKTTRTPAPVPSTRPVLYRVDNEPLLQRLWFSDETTPGSKAKPKGVAMCEIRQTLVPAGGAAPTNQNAMPLLAMDTKSPHRTDLEPGDQGQTAYYAARWLNTAGTPGPWGAITGYPVV